MENDRLFFMASQKCSQTRVPKASTITAAKWAPCDSRIEQLYVDEHKSVKTVRETVNREFGLNANDRQVKRQIKKLRLERNAKKNERDYIVRKVTGRKQEGKQTGVVRIRGHQVTEQILKRWIREVDPCLTSNSVPQSPSGISICTAIRSRSPTPTRFLPYTAAEFTPVIRRDESESAFLARLCRYAIPGVTSYGDETYTLLDDLKTILTCKPSHPPKPDRFGDLLYDQCGLIGEREIRQIISLVDIERNAISDGSKTVLIEPVLSYSYIPWARGNQAGAEKKTTSWLTLYGRVDVSLWIRKNIAYPYATNENMETSASALEAVKIAITTKNTISPFRVEFQLMEERYGHLLNSPKIVYQAIVPDNSKIFEIAERGTSKQLLDAVLSGAARLTDRDTAGRSLLNYALRGTNPDVCKLLLENGADSDEIEPNISGHIWPLNMIDERIECKEDEDDLMLLAECTKLLAEKGSDYSLFGNIGDDRWICGLEWIIFSGSVTRLEYVLKHGSPFINPLTFTNVAGELSSPLITLAGLHFQGSSSSFHTVDKALLLIQFGADVNFRAQRGITALSVLLGGSDIEPGDITAFQELREVLRIFLAAGVNIYEVSSKGFTPTDYAVSNNLKNAWIEALEFCGYEAKAVFAHSHWLRYHSELGPDPNFVPQKPKVSLEEFRELRDAGELRYKDTDIDFVYILSEDTCDECDDESGSEEEEYQEEEGEEVRGEAESSQLIISNARTISDAEHISDKMEVNEDNETETPQVYADGQVSHEDFNLEFNVDLPPGLDFDVNLNFDSNFDMDMNGFQGGFLDMQTREHLDPNVGLAFDSDFDVNLSLDSNFDMGMYGF